MTIFPVRVSSLTLSLGTLLLGTFGSPTAASLWSSNPTNTRYCQWIFRVAGMPTKEISTTSLLLLLWFRWVCPRNAVRVSRVNIFSEEDLSLRAFARSWRSWCPSLKKTHCIAGYDMFVIFTFILQQTEH